MCCEDYKKDITCSYDEKALFGEDEFILGCNYWASNAGTDMWRDWDEKAVRSDLDILTAHEVKYLRVFINWRDFQPVMPMMQGGASVYEYCMEGDRPLENPYGLDEKMMQRFDCFCDICEEYGVRLIVGLVTGWMSGRTFVPSALYGKDLYSDAVSMSFQMKLVKGIVQRFKGKKAIVGWDLGNECNCVIPAKSREEAYTWTGMIANAIRANDASRPVVSGMHSIKAADSGARWTIADQAEFCDVLTTHPYPLWVEHAYQEFTVSYRTLNHASCETKYYSDLGDKPCLVEEIGTMGPMICDEEKAAQFLRVNLLSNWIHGAEGLMWWCANEQTNLTAQPYTRNMCEIELGMIRADRTPRPVLLEMKNFAERRRQWNISIPKAKEDAVCILTSGQDQWGTAYMSWCLAQQVSMNLKFCYIDKKIPDAPVYLLPSVSGTGIMPRELYLELKERVRKGAILYVSNDNGILAEFEELTGLRVADSGKYHHERTVEVNGALIPFVRNQFYKMKPIRAEVLAYDNEGDVAISVHTYGKGRVYYVNFPLESMMINESDAFDKNRHLIYQEMFGGILSERAVQTDNPNVTVTFHPIDESSMYCALMNYSVHEQETNLKVRAEYQITEIITGSVDKVEAAGMTLFKLRKV